MLITPFMWWLMAGFSAISISYRLKRIAEELRCLNRSVRNVAQHSPGQGIPPSKKAHTLEPTVPGATPGSSGSLRDRYHGLLERSPGHKNCLRLDGIP